MRAGLVLAAIVVAGAAAAQEVPVETGVLGGSAITLHLHPFLTAEELATLRLVMTNEQALALFVPEKSGFAALAMSPDDGFIRGGAPVASAIALGDLPAADEARAGAVAACDVARKGTVPCVVVLDVAPAR